MKSNKGQIAVILIFIIAVGIIFYFLANNVGKIGQAKVATMRGATVGAAQLVSEMASYGERLLQEQLGGKRKICKSTSLLGLILKLIIVIVVWFFAPEVAPALQGLFTASFVALTVMISVSIVLQITVVQPGITKMWNKYMSKMLKPVDQFMEQAIQSALLQSVSDQVQIPDWYDSNGDGVYGDITVPTDPTTAPDYISRFAFYYTKRLKGALAYPGTDVPKMQAFLDDLRKFVYGDPAASNPGLWNPIDCSKYAPGGHPCCPVNKVTDPNYPAMCDLCCVPKISIADLPLCCVPVPVPPATEGWCGEPDLVNPSLPKAGSVCDPGTIRPSCCDLAAGNPLKCGDPTTCWNRTPFDATYPWVYDPALEDSLNGRKSIRQLFGKDDEHRDFNVKVANPNWDLSIPGGIQTATGTGFVGKDTTGFYGPGDNQTGIFPMFHESKSYNVELSTLTYAGDECHWCSVQAGACADSARIPRLALAAATATVNNPSYCLDSVNIGAGPPLRADAVSQIPVNVPAGNCASGVGGDPGWKPGGDAYCQNSAIVYPYAASCAKNKIAGNLCDDGGGELRDCTCDEFALGGGNPALWPDDHLDEFIYGLGEFFNTIKPILSMSAASLYQNFQDWYEPVIADWIEPGCTDPSCPGPTCVCPGSYTGETREGVFWVWRRELQWFIAPINAWLNGIYTSNDVWCVPAADPPCARVAEIATFTSGGGPRGNLTSVLACLDWNANDTWPGLGPTGNPVVGNALKFAACSDQAWCVANGALCAQLPRSLDPGYCAAWGAFQAPNLPDIARFQACFNTGPIPKPPLNLCDSAVSCNAQCAGLPVMNNNALPPVAYAVPAFTAATFKSVIDSQACSRWDIPPYGFLPVLDTCTASDIYRSSCPPLTPDPACVTLCVSAEATCVAACAGDAICIAACTTASVTCQAACPLFTQDPTCMTLCVSAEATCVAACAGDAVCIAGCTAARVACQAACPEAPNTCTCEHEYVMVDTPGSCTDAAFFTSVQNNGIISAQGTCGNAAFQAAATSSSLDAVNQVLKFRKRISFLNLLITDATTTRDTIQKAVDHITAFLDAGTPYDQNDVTKPADSPAERLIDLRFNQVDPVNGNSADAALPGNAIYVWQDPPVSYVREDGTTDGFWHAVKVEGRLPRRCNGACGTDKWPSVKTKTKRWGLTRCYFMVDTEGMVKFRVIRFDEDRDSKKFVFPNGVPIFGKIRLTHPDGGPIGSGLGGMALTCQLKIQNDPKMTAAATTLWGNAFMLDSRDKNDVSFQECWNRVHADMLRFGVVTDMCASYFIAGGTMGGASRDSMRMKFVPCDAGFLDGTN